MLTKSIKFGSLEITARELSVREIRDWVAADDVPDVAKPVRWWWPFRKPEPVDPVGDCLIEDMTFKMMAMFSDIKPKDFETLTPSEIAELSTTIREVNPGFFDLTGRWQKTADLLNED